MKSLLLLCSFLLTLSPIASLGQTDAELELRKARIELEKIRIELERQRRESTAKDDAAEMKTALDSLNNSLDKKRKVLEADLEFLMKAQETRFLGEQEIFGSETELIMPVR